MDKLTKIVATIGPATESEETLAELIKAGMNVARFNTKHADPEWHNDRIQRVYRVSQALKTPIAILLDLQGPEIRVDLPNNESFDVAADETVTLSQMDTTQTPGNKKIFVPSEVIEGLPEGSRFVLEDGACEFEIVQKTSTQLTAKAITSCTVKARKTMNTPGVVLNMPSLTDRDYTYLEGVDLSLVDYVGLSFVRDAKDIQILKQELTNKDAKAKIISKIENQKAIDNLDEIIRASDALMVARGDLGVEVAYEELIHWQKVIITKARQAAKPVITATEMLKSMVENPRPTRAEVSDVAHALYDGTDAVMLSDETTMGKHPVKAVEVQARIAAYNEQFVDNESLNLDFDPTTATSAISYSAVQLVRESALPISKIVCLTETGLTARVLASYHSEVPIHMVTSNERTVRESQLLYGVTAHLMSIPEGMQVHSGNLLEACKNEGIVSTGETVLFIHGSIWKHPGLTNTVSVITIS
jgi:pyruvate kinase